VFKKVPVTKIWIDRALHIKTTLLLFEDLTLLI